MPRDRSSAEKALHSDEPHRANVSLLEVCGFIMRSLFHIFTNISLVSTDSPADLSTRETKDQIGMALVYPGKVINHCKLLLLPT